MYHYFLFSDDGDIDELGERFHDFNNHRVERLPSVFTSENFEEAFKKKKTANWILNC